MSTRTGHKTLERFLPPAPARVTHLCRARFMLPQDAVERVVPASEGLTPRRGAGCEAGGRGRGRGRNEAADGVGEVVEEGVSDCVQEIGSVREGEDALVRDAEDEVEVIVGPEPEDRVRVLVPPRDLATRAVRVGGSLLDQGFADQGIERVGCGGEGALPEDESAWGPGQGGGGGGDGPKESAREGTWLGVCESAHRIATWSSMGRLRLRCRRNERIRFLIASPRLDRFRSASARDEETISPPPIKLQSFPARSPRF